MNYTISEANQVVEKDKKIDILERIDDVRYEIEDLIDDIRSEIEHLIIEGSIKNVIKFTVTINNEYCLLKVFSDDEHKELLLYSMVDSWEEVKDLFNTLVPKLEIFKNNYNPDYEEQEKTYSHCDFLKCIYKMDYIEDYLLINGAKQHVCNYSIRHLNQVFKINVTEFYNKENTIIKYTASSWTELKEVLNKILPRNKFIQKKLQEPGNN